MAQGSAGKSRRRRRGRRNRYLRIPLGLLEADLDNDALATAVRILRALDDRIYETRGDERTELHLGATSIARLTRRARWDYGVPILERLLDARSRVPFLSDLVIEPPDSSQVGARSELGRSQVGPSSKLRWPKAASFLGSRAPTHTQTQTQQSLSLSTDSDSVPTAPPGAAIRGVAGVAPAPGGEEGEEPRSEPSSSREQATRFLLRERSRAAGEPFAVLEAEEIAAEAAKLTDNQVAALLERRDDQRQERREAGRRRRTAAALQHEGRR